MPMQFALFLGTLKVCKIFSPSHPWFWQLKHGIRLLFSGVTPGGGNSSNSEQRFQQSSREFPQVTHKISSVSLDQRRT